MLSQVLSIARNTLIESLRQPIFFVLIMICGLLQAFNTASTGFSMGYTTTAEVSGDDKLLLDIGMGTIFVIGALLAGFQATAVISREIVDKTVLTVVSKPVARPTIVVGKFLGVLGAILMAVVIMVTFLLFGIRHEVMTMAADDVDMPVVIFSVSAVLLSLALATFGNFFYGWSFPQVAVVGMFALVPASYALTLMISKEWEFQPIGTDFKPQVFTACVALGVAIMVLASIATAASTRLSQVMTIVVCCGVFVMGLLSNHLVGRLAFQNEFVAVVRSAEPEASRFEGFDSVAARYRIELVTFPEQTLEPGDSIWYGSNPTGFALAVPRYEPFTGDPTDRRIVSDDSTPPAIVVAEADGTSLVLEQVGGRPVPVERAPREGDYMFLQPTEVNPVALGIWGAIPNMHYFWLLDAVTQNREVPAGHLLRVLLYGLAQTAAFLCLAVILFQRRDVG
ncbi:MAG: ABC transporter permease [Phycisphaerales bacterium]